LGVSRLKNEQVVKIIDLMPTSVEDLKVILSGYNISLPNDVLDKIVAAVKEFL
jgi:DNA-directed RNA polymerase subunit F